MNFAEGLEFRRMCPEDLEQVLAIQASLAFQAWNENHFMAEISDLHYSQPYVLMEQEFGRMLGYVVCKIASDEAELCTIAVAREFQQRGHAFAMLEASLLELEERSVTNVFLEVRVGNAAAKALYSRCGFTEAGIRKRYYPDGEDAIVMVKDLLAKNVGVQ